MSDTANDKVDWSLTQSEVRCLPLRRKELSIDPDLGQNVHLEYRHRWHYKLLEEHSCSKVSLCE